MKSVAHLSQIIGTLADQKEDIVHYDQESLTQSVSALLKRELNDLDGSAVRVYEVLGASLQNNNLPERLVAEVIYALVNLQGTQRYQKKIRGYLPLALNHPNISQMDYVNLISGYMKSGFWLTTDYSHHLVKKENTEWHPDNIVIAIGNTIPSLREVLNHDEISDGGIDYFLTQFFTVFSQIVDVNDERVLMGLEQLIKKCAPQRIRKLNAPREGKLVPVLDPKWGDSFLAIKKTFLEQFNKLPYDPSPYGMGR